MGNELAPARFRACPHTRHPAGARGARAGERGSRGAPGRCHRSPSPPPSPSTALQGRDADGPLCSRRQFIGVITLSSPSRPRRPIAAQGPGPHGSRCPGEEKWPGLPEPLGWCEGGGPQMCMGTRDRCHHCTKGGSHRNPRSPQEECLRKSRGGLTYGSELPSSQSKNGAPQRITLRLRTSNPTPVAVHLQYHRDPGPGHQLPATPHMPHQAFEPVSP